MHEIERRIAALNVGIVRLTRQFDRILKNGEGASGPTADGVHVPAPLGDRKKKPKKKVAADD